MEQQAWPEEATVCALMSIGFSHGEAVSLTPLESRRYLAIDAAWSIPPKERRGGTVNATMEDARRMLGGLNG